jgi:hypothetical protein
MLILAKTAVSRTLTVGIVPLRIGHVPPGVYQKGPTDMSDQDSRTSHLRNYFFDGVPLPGSLLAEDGLDVELLARFVRQLRPSMDHLRGYRPLDSWFTATTHVPYDTWLNEAGLADQYAHCIPLLRVMMQKKGARDNWIALTVPGQGDGHGEAKRFAELRVYLTREGEWIVWASYPASDFRVVETAEQAVAAITELTPDDISLSDAHGLLRSPALRMLVELRNFVRESTGQWRQAVQRDEWVVDGINTVLKRFQMP